MVAITELNYVLPGAIFLFTLAMIIYSYRVLKGPTVPDMVLALDALTVDLIVLFILITLYYRTPYLAIGAIPLSAWVFILDIYVAKYLLEVKKNDR